MARIHILAEPVVNRIAAGEVVERPASVVKELMENSLDAESGRVEVDLEAGGCRLIAVRDDGCGLSPEDLALAWQSHATSKLARADDLERILTLGFRGEALPSIGAVSQALMVSRARGALEGARIAVAGGRTEGVTAAGCPEGTRVEVRNLFYNVPARKKFLRTPATEQGHAAEAFTRIALAYPDVAFRLRADGRDLLRLPGGVSLAERIRGLFGGRIAEHLVEVGADSTALRVHGYAGRPALHRSNAQMVYFFLNGRFIRDKMLLRAVTEAYRGLLPSGRFPVVFLMLRIAPERVDVNVHPSKAEVRFREPQPVYRQVVRALAAVRRGEPRTLTADLEPAAPADATQRRQEIQQAISDFLARRPSASPAAPAPTAPPAAPSAPVRPRTARRFCQFRNAYIVEETDEGIHILDQHALHERVLYEMLQRRAGGPVQSQRLLVPSVVELRPRDLTLVMELREVLRTMGVEVETFGPGSVAVRAVPQILERADPGELLVDLLDEVRRESSGTPRADLVRRALACRGAVKSGVRLRDEEIAWLLDQRDALALPATCPHGRPLALRLTDAELNRRFQRT